MFDKFKEECGVVAIYGHPEAARLANLGLHALQHRGADGLAERALRVDVDDREAGRLESRSRTPGRDQLDAGGGEPAGERDEARLVGHRQQGAANLCDLGHGAMLPWFRHLRR